MATWDLWIGGVVTISILNVRVAREGDRTVLAALARQSRFFGQAIVGPAAHLADGVQRALGRAPRDFTDYARDAAATGVWNVGPEPAEA